jgi:hypothetical protein
MNSKKKLKLPLTSEKNEINKFPMVMPLYGQKGKYKYIHT